MTERHECIIGILHRYRRGEAGFAEDAAIEIEALFAPMNYMRAMDLAENGFRTWAAKEHNRKWVRRIDGTPIQNDLLVNIAEAFAHGESTNEKG